MSRAWAVQTNAAASPNDPVVFEQGPLVRAFTHDGVGRLVRIVSPWPTPELASGEVRVERYFYDGVRRISEVVTDPMDSIALALAGNAGGEAQGEAEEAVEEEEDLETEGLTVGVQQAQANPNTPVSGEHLSREYIWGPSDTDHRSISRVV